MRLLLLKKQKNLSSRLTKLMKNVSQNKFHIKALTAHLNEVFVIVLWRKPPKEPHLAAHAVKSRVIRRKPLKVICCVPCGACCWDLRQQGREIILAPLLRQVLNWAACRHPRRGLNINLSSSASIRSSVVYIIWLRKHEKTLLRVVWSSDTALSDALFLSSGHYLYVQHSSGRLHTQSVSGSVRLPGLSRLPRWS